MLFMLIAFTLTACSSDDNESENNNQTNHPKRTYRLEVQAENGAKTRALSLDQTGKILTPSWEEGEKLGVHTWFDNGLYYEPIYIGTLSAQETGNPTTFTGDVQDQPEYHYQMSKGTKLLFVYPNPTSFGHVLSYDEGYDKDGRPINQDGTIGTIASAFDYATAKAEVDKITENNDKLYIMLKGGNKLTFKNHTAIVAFTVVDENDTPLLPAKFIVNGKGLVKTYNILNAIQKNIDPDQQDIDPYTCFYDGTSPTTYQGGLEISVANPESPIYVAMANKYDEPIDYSFFVSARPKNNSQLFSYECKMKANLKPGTFYATKLKMKKVDQWDN